MLSGCTATGATTADMDVRLRGSGTSVMRAGGTRWEEAAEIRTSRGGRLAAGGIFRGKFRRSDESRGAGPQQSAPEGPPRVEETPAGGAQRRKGALERSAPGQACAAFGRGVESDIFDIPRLEFLHGPIYENPFRAVVFQASDTDAVRTFGRVPFTGHKLHQRQKWPLRKVGQARQKPPMHRWLPLTKLLVPKDLSGFGKC